MTFLGEQVTPRGPERERGTVIFISNYFLIIKTVLGEHLLSRHMLKTELPFCYCAYIHSAHLGMVQEIKFN